MNATPNDASTRRWHSTPEPTERLWTLRKGPRFRDAEIRDLGSGGVELHMLDGGVVFYSRLCSSRAVAMAEAAACRATYEADGWLLA